MSVIESFGSYFPYRRGKLWGDIGLQSENGQLSTKSDFESDYIEHICVLLDIIYNIFVYQYVSSGILCMFCIFIGIFEYCKYMIIYYFLIYYSMYIHVS